MGDVCFLSGWLGLQSIASKLHLQMTNELSFMECAGGWD